MTEQAQAPQPGAGLAPAAGAFGAEVLSKLSHELRSPLAGIIGLARVLQLRISAGSADAATQLRQLDMIQASAASSLSTIERVVDLAKIQSGRVRPSPVPADCRDIITGVAAELREASARRGVSLRADLPCHPVMVTTDPSILGRLLTELVSNGLRFTDAGEVRIGLRGGERGGERAVIDVSDDGPGIPAHEQARIFEPFERGELAAEGDDGDEGAPGLGLHLARQQAGLLGARLSLASQAGSGSTFSIALADLPAPPGSVPGTDPRS